MMKTMMMAKKKNQMSRTKEKKSIWNKKLDFTVAYILCWRPHHFAESSDQTANYEALLQKKHLRGLFRFGIFFKIYKHFFRNILRCAFINFIDR